MTRSARCTATSAASLVIIGDAFHTFVDGVVIAAAVITSVPLGVTTALAVAAHEIPQEVGDVCDSSPRRLLEGACALPQSHFGRRRRARCACHARRIEGRPDALPSCSPSPRGSFLYIAMSDLIPDLHRGGLEGGAVRQLLLIVAGVLTIVLL